MALASEVRQLVEARFGTAEVAEVPVILLSGGTGRESDRSACTTLDLTSSRQDRQAVGLVAHPLHQVTPLSSSSRIDAFDRQVRGIIRSLTPWTSSQVQAEAAAPATSLVGRKPVDAGPLRRAASRRSTLRRGHAGAAGAAPPVVLSSRSRASVRW